MMKNKQLHPSWDPEDKAMNVKTEEEEEVVFMKIKEEEIPSQISFNPEVPILRNVKTEEEEEIFMKNKEEEISLQISPDPEIPISRNVKTEEEEEVIMKIIGEEIPLQISPEPGVPILRNVKTEEEEEVLMKIIGEEIPLQICPDPGDTIVTNLKEEEEEIPLQISTGIIKPRTRSINLKSSITRTHCEMVAHTADSGTRPLEGVQELEIQAYGIQNAAEKTRKRRQNENKNTTLLEPVIKGCRCDGTDDALFFRSLLPYVNKIPQHLKLQFKNRVRQLVNQFVHPDLEDIPYTPSPGSSYGGTSSNSNEQTVQTALHADIFQAL